MSKVIIVCFLLIFSAFAQASGPQTVYLTPHDLFVEALKHGQAQGELRGAVAERFGSQFKSTGPLLAHVKRIKRYRQPGCGRLNLVLTQKDVDTPKGKTDAILRMQLNY